MRSSIFRDVTQRRLVVGYCRLDCLTLEDRTGKLSRNVVTNCQFTLRDIPEEL